MSQHYEVRHDDLELAFVLVHTVKAIHRPDHKPADEAHPGHGEGYGLGSCPGAAHNLA